jgi:hypothetical protein
LSGWDQLLTHVEPHDHLVQFYDKDEQLLVTKVGHYLFEGWRAGEALLVVGGPQRNSEIAEQFSALGIDAAAAVKSGRLVFFDAAEMVARLTVAGPPEWSRFDALVGSAVRDLKARHGALRAYGEMVGILWRHGQHAAAARLEEFWNRLMRDTAISLFCAYPIDVFGREFDMAGMEAILCAHTHLLPTGRNDEVGVAVDRAMVDVLGARAGGLKKVIHTYFRPSLAAVPKAEGVVLWLRSNLPQYAESILNRAREYYTAG